MITVLCENEAIPVGRYVTTITREIEGGEVEAFHERTGTGAEMTISQADMENTQRAITVAKKKRRKGTKTKTSAPEDITPETFPGSSSRMPLRELR